MSWIVQSLLNSKDRIKHRSEHYHKEYGNIPNIKMVNLAENEQDANYGYNDPQIDSDEFNDLLMVEKAIEELKSKKLLSPDEIKVLNFFGNSRMDANKPDVERHTLSKRYSHICNRIAYYMGGYFTDEGYLEYMRDKYKLDDPQIETLRNYMQSKYRHKIKGKSRIDENKHETPIEN